MANFTDTQNIEKNLPTLEKQPSELRGKIFEKLFEFASIERLTTTEMEEYRKSILDYDDVRDAAECAREEGIQIGIEKGMEKSLKEVAKTCLQKGMTVKEIAEITRLSAEQIEELK